MTVHKWDNSRLHREEIGAQHLSRLLGDWFSGSGRTGVRLAASLNRLIRSGQLPGGSRLPSERALASAFGVARGTVTDAFDILRSGGTVVSRTGAGTYVTTLGRSATARGDARLQSFVRKSTVGRIDLRSAALPAVPMVREELLRSQSTEYDSLLGSHGLFPEGLPGLREAIADYYNALGLPTTREQVLVTSGAQQALGLVVTDLIEPGTTAVIEEPTYRGAIELLRRSGARIVSVPCDEHGTDEASLRAQLHTEHPAMVLLQTTVHNPTGAVLPESGRRAISRLSRASGAQVIDHSPARDALIDGEPLTPLAAYDDTVITVGSASKAFWGGLRIGWLRADDLTIERLAAAKAGCDLGASVPAQLITTRLLNRIGEVRDYRRDTLAVAREWLLQALACDFSAWDVQMPAGGASMWITLPGRQATTLTEHARRNGVDILAGPTFSNTDGLNDRIRLPFSVPRGDLEVALHRLLQVWHSQHQPLSHGREPNPSRLQRDRGNHLAHNDPVKATPPAMALDRTPPGGQP